MKTESTRLLTRRTRKYIYTYHAKCKDIYTNMAWRKELGEKIRAARKAKDLSQEELALLLKTPITRAQISNIENGKSAPAVNIVTEIALALGTSFEVGGCQICSTPSEMDRIPAPSPAQQLCFAFDTEYRFTVASLRISSTDPDALLLNLRLGERKVA